VEFLASRLAGETGPMAGCARGWQQDSACRQTPDSSKGTAMTTSKTTIELTGQKGAVFVFLFMSVMAFFCFLGALVLGTEPRMDFLRTGERKFQVTAFNTFSGVTFYSRSIQGVGAVTLDDAYRDRRSDSKIEKRKQRQRKHLDFTGDAGANLRWDREDDQQKIEEFMRGNQASFTLEDPAPMWRKAAAWFFVVFGFLTFMGGVGAFFPKAKGKGPV
jgi:hypothetical protein